LLKRRANDFIKTVICGTVLSELSAQARFRAESYRVYRCFRSQHIGIGYQVNG
jgi:hypothetical protein